MRTSQTSDRVSSIAARYFRITAQELAARTANNPEGVAGELRSMAASLLRQDEVKGLRGIVRKVLGR